MGKLAAVIKFLFTYWPVVQPFVSKTWAALPSIVMALSKLASRDYAGAFNDLAIAFGLGAVQHAAVSAKEAAGVVAGAATASLALAVNDRPARSTHLS